MRLILRFVGTILLAASLILVILDGTRSLADNTLVMTPLGTSWEQMHKESLEGLRAFVQTRFFGPLLEGTINAILGLPGWIVLGVPGAFLAWLGRSRRSRVFVRQDQI